MDAANEVMCVGLNCASPVVHPIAMHTMLRHSISAHLLLAMTVSPWLRSGHVFSLLMRHSLFTPCHCMPKLQPDSP